MAKDPLAFEYYGGPQRAPEWYKIKRGRIGASSLWRWLAVSKAAKTLGKPLKPRLDYETELMFERQFDTSFEVYVNSAMQDGIDYEDFAAQQYATIKGVTLEEQGCYYNDFFCASPDRKITGVNAGIEVKIVKDNTFTEILVSGVPDKHYKQIQGQLWGTGWDYVDYVALNFNTKKIVIIRVQRDEELIKYLELSVQEKLVVSEFQLEDRVFDVIGEIPESVEFGAEVDRSDSNINGEW